jgi:NADPH-dependent glutamate synthase beta subunit-like oxidoreductase
LGSKVEDPRKLLAEGYDAVCVAVGLWQPIRLGIENEDLAVTMTDLLASPGAHTFSERVAVVGGGATAVDCAVTAKTRGADHVELFMLEKLSEMPLTAKERQELIDFDIEVNGRIRVQRIVKGKNGVGGVETIKVELPEGRPSTRAMSGMSAGRREQGPISGLSSSRSACVRRFRSNVPKGSSTPAIW